MRARVASRALALTHVHAVARLAQAKVGELLSNVLLGGRVEWTLDRLMKVEVQESEQKVLKYIWDVYTSREVCCPIHNLFHPLISL